MWTYDPTTGDFPTLFRQLPISALGHFKSGLVYKVMTIIHQVFLDSGPTAGGIRLWFSRVTACVTDLGVEYNACDFPDVVSYYMRNETPSEDDNLRIRGTFLFPVAMGIPGVNHLVDWLIKDSHESIPWWKKYEGMAKCYCSCVRQGGWRQDIQQRLTAAELPDLHDELDSFGADFAKWRWKTLHAVNKTIYKTCEAVKLGYDESTCSRDAKVKKAMTELLNDPSFMEMNAASYFITTRVMQLRGCLVGCRCHAKECVAAAKSGRTFKCFMKGRTGAILKDTVDATKLAWIDDRQVIPRQGYRCPGVTPGLFKGFNRLIAMLEHKFKFRNLLPWLIWVCRDPARCAVVKDYYDEQMQDPIASQRMHRVAHRFFNINGEFYDDVMDHIQLRGLSDTLDDAFNSYEMAIVDETAVEAIHGKITRIQSIATAATLATWCARVRQAQNFHIYDCAKANGTDWEFRRAYENYKSVLQTSALKFRRYISVKTKRLSFLARVYRLGAHNAVDYSSVGKEFAKSTNVAYNRPSEASDATSLMKDFCRGVMRQGEFFTYPTADGPSQFEAPGVAPARLTTTDTAAAAEHQEDDDLADQSVVATASLSGCGIAQTLVCLQVIDSKPQQNKLPYAFDMAAKHFPMIIQRWRVNIAPFEGELQCQPSYSIVCEDAPELVDILREIPRDVLQKQLMRWDTSAASDYRTHLSLCAPRRAMDRNWDIKTIEYPAIAMIWGLHVLGWTRGRALKDGAHDVAEDVGTFCEVDCVTRKSYLRCLLMIQELRSRGLHELPLELSDWGGWK